ncbi:MAG: hypothetical protein ACOX25_11710 [Caldicoprobacterales bacterium]|jgi:hypothetical protein|nr:hypothetical protein [Clostridiales bacterium]
MMKKFLGLMLVCILVLSLSACFESPTQTPIKDNDSPSTSTEEPSTPSLEPEDQDVAEDPDVTIEETILLDQDGLVITAKKLVDDPIWGIGLQVLIENNTEDNLGVQCNSLIVNNYMITDLFSSSVAAGKKANETIYLSSTELEAAGIKTISDIVVSFHVFEDDSYSTLFDTDEIEIQTSAYGTVEQPAMDDGKELFNQDGIRIIGRYVEEDSFWGAGVLLFIENNYGENIIVQCDNMSINGFMVTPYFSSTVNDGRMALSDITILSSDLEDNGIEKIEDIELVFHIINPDTFATIFETDPIAFSTN